MGGEGESDSEKGKHGRAEEGRASEEMAEREGERERGREGEKEREREREREGERERFVPRKKLAPSPPPPLSVRPSVVRLVHLKTLSLRRQRGQSFIPPSNIYLCPLFGNVHE